MFRFLLEHPDVVQAVTGVIGLIVVVPGLYFGARQLKIASDQLTAAKRSVQADFLMRFDQMLDRYDHIHKKLRPGGEWAASEDTKFEPDQWAEIERYMGLFERGKILMDDGFIDISTFDRLYGYRVRNIEANATIKTEKLVKRASGWRDFIELAEALHRHRESGKAH